MKDYIKLLRPKHVIKNLLIFFPLIFSKNMLNANLLKKSTVSFIIFSIIASVIYIINDIKDKDKDAMHPTKCKRPIASGKIPIIKAISFAMCIIIFSVFLIYKCKLNKFSIIYLTIYFFINILYSFGLKNIPLIDIIILVLGFIIRILYGAEAINVEVSSWLLLTITTFSFYLGMGKRRNEIDNNGSKSRKVLESYNKNFLDKNMPVFLSSTIVFYALWSVDIKNLNNNNLLIWTVPLIIVIAMKYSMNIEENNSGDPVEVILRDKILIFLLVIYVILLIAILYFI